MMRCEVILPSNEIIGEITEYYPILSVYEWPSNATLYLTIADIDLQQSQESSFSKNSKNNFCIFTAFINFLYLIFKVSSRGGLEVELRTDNSLPSALVDQIPLGAMYLYGTICTRYIYKVYRRVLYVCVMPFGINVVDMYLP